jgi:SAM-dependent methyltransferase
MQENFANYRRIDQEGGSITQSEIRKIIRSYGKWYQNIRFGFMLETHYIALPLEYRILAECRRLVRKWLGRKTKVEILLESLPDLTGKRIIDIGCNSGLYSVEASCRGAGFVLGVDINPKAIMQARDVAEIFRKLGRVVGNCEFRTVDINNNLYLIDNMDVLMACCVLYHLGPLDRFKARIVQSKIHSLILQGNTHRLSRIGKYNNPSADFYNRENKKWGNVLCDINGMIDFCCSMGFRVEKVAFLTHSHPVVIAVRD